MEQLLNLFPNVNFKHSLDDFDLERFNSEHASLYIYNKALIKYLISHRYNEFIADAFNFNEISFKEAVNWFHNSLLANIYLAKFFDLTVKRLKFLPLAISSDTATYIFPSILNQTNTKRSELLMYDMKRYLILDSENKFQSVIAIHLKIKPINYAILIAHDLKKIVINKNGNIFEIIKDYYFEEIFEHAFDMNESLSIIDENWTYDIIYREILLLTNNYQETDVIMDSYKDLESMFDMLQMIKI
jgi:hypothetical protein